MLKNKIKSLHNKGNNMEAGDPILVNVNGEGNWRHGTFLGDRRLDCPGSVTDGETVYNVGIGEPHYFSYEENEVHPQFVKRFIPLSEEDATAKHQAEFPQVVALVESALSDLLPGEKVEIKELSIFGYRGGVTLDPVVYEKPCIGAVQETAGWLVNVVHYHHETRYQPEDYEMVEVGEASDWQTAVQLFIETIFKLKSDDYWGGLADEEMQKAEDDFFRDEDYFLDEEIAKESDEGEM